MIEGTYLTAKEAAALAQEAQSIKGSFMRKDTDKILESISLCAREGKNECQIAFPLHKIVQDRLKHLGYSVKIHSDQREGSWTVISW